MTLRAPFPWFGGKSRVAPHVWLRFGNVATYNEPFAGSLAVLLGRPHPPRIETVNDLDCYLANFWRALQHDPAGVAYHADSPVNEADLHARHRWLVQVARPTAERVMTEADFYDVKIAGWWVWGQCLWIGSGWCEARKAPATTARPETGLVNAKGVHRGQFDRNGLGTVHQKRRPHLTKDQGIVIQRSAATRSAEDPCEQHKRFRTDGDTGIHARRWQGGGAAGGSGVHAPRLTSDEWQQRPDLADSAGRGVHAPRLRQQVPQLSGDGSGASRGVLSEGVRTQGLYDYLEHLAVRLRRVRVCCGDWKRVLTPSVTTYIGICGVFLDPPYTHELRERCYSEDHDISADVRAWALEHGDDPKMRIALCGYAGEHEMPASWECVPWKAHGGYSRSVRGRANRERERIWFSPHCQKAGLFSNRTEVADEEQAEPAGV